jgi:hypothetical protein
MQRLTTLLEHENELLEQEYHALKKRLTKLVYEGINGPHFTEDCAHEAVEHMENEDGSKGPHWTVEETTSVANQMGIDLNTGKVNKWDWYVAMNMIYSDFYKAVVSLTGGANTKSFAELTKAWVCDKDVSEGKMWHYFMHIMKHKDLEDNEVVKYREAVRTGDIPEELRIGREMYERYNKPIDDAYYRGRHTSYRYF